MLPHVGNNKAEASYIIAKMILKLPPEDPFKEVTEKQLASKAASIRRHYYRAKDKYEKLRKRLSP